MRNENGFTFIEVLAALMIITTFLIVIHTTYMQIIFLKNKSTSFYELTRVAQSIMEDIKSNVDLINDHKDLLNMDMDMEKELNFIRDGYNSNVLILKECQDRGIYKIIITVIDEKYSKEYRLKAFIYDMGQKNIYDEIYYEIPI